MASLGRVSAQGPAERAPSSPLLIVGWSVAAWAAGGPPARCALNRGDHEGRSPETPLVQPPV